MVHRAAGAVGKHQRLAPSVEEVSAPGEGVLAAGHQRHTVMVGEGRSAHGQRRRRCRVELEVQAQLVIGEVGPDAFQLDSVALPEGGVADGHPCLDRAAPVDVAVAAGAGHVDREQVAEDLDPVLLGRVELAGRPLTSSSMRSVKFLLPCGVSRLRTWRIAGRAGVAQSLMTTVWRLIGRPPAGGGRGERLGDQRLPGLPEGGGVGGRACLAADLLGGAGERARQAARRGHADARFAFGKATRLARGDVTGVLAEQLAHVAGDQLGWRSTGCGELVGRLRRGGVCQGLRARRDARQQTEKGAFGQGAHGAAGERLTGGACLCDRVLQRLFGAVGGPQPVGQPGVRLQ